MNSSGSTVSCQRPFWIQAVSAIVWLVLSVFALGQTEEGAVDDLQDSSELVPGDEKIDGPAAWRAKAERVRAAQAKPNRLLEVYETHSPYDDLPDKLFNERDYEFVERGLTERLRELPDPVAARNYKATLEKLGSFPYAHEPEDLRALVAEWTERRPQSHFAWLVRGLQAIDYAWYWRGNGYAHTVSDEGLRNFIQALTEARAYIEKSHELEPDDPETSGAMLWVCIGLGMSRSEFGAYFDRVIRIVPAHVSAYAAKLQYLLPKWYGSWDEVDQFVVEIEQEAARQDQPWLLLMKLQAFREMERDRPGYKEILRGDAIREEILAMRQAIVRRWPEDLGARAELARAFVLREMYRNAVAQFEFIGNRFPTTGPYSLAEHHHVRVISHYRLMIRLPDAELEPAIVRLIAIDPEHWGSHEAVGMVYVDRERYESAEEAFLEAVRLNPTAPMLRVRLADLYLRMNRIADAQLAIDTGRQLDPNPNTTKRLDDLESRLESASGVRSEP